MKALMSACLLFLGCAGIPPGEGFQSCDAIVAGDYEDRFAKSGLTRTDVNRGVRVALDAATFTTDIRLGDTLENCRKLYGYRVYTMPVQDFLAPWDKKTYIAGFTNCRLKLIVVGTPKSPFTWADSALVHEIFHAFQECEGTPPQDPNPPAEHHENWSRDGIFNAIDWARTQP